MKRKAKPKTDGKGKKDQISSKKKSSTGLRKKAKKEVENNVAKNPSHKKHKPQLDTRNKPQLSPQNKPQLDAQIAATTDTSPETQQSEQSKQNETTGGFIRKLSKKIFKKRQQQPETVVEPDIVTTTIPITSQMLTNVSVHRSYWPLERCYSFQLSLFIDQKLKQSQCIDEYCVSKDIDREWYYLFVDRVWFIQIKEWKDYANENFVENGHHLYANHFGVLHTFLMHANEKTSETDSESTPNRIHSIYPSSYRKQLNYGVMIVAKHKRDGSRRWYYHCSDYTRGIWDLDYKNVPYVQQCAQRNRFTTEQYCAVLLDYNTQLVMIELVDGKHLRSKKNYTLFLGGTIILCEGQFCFGFSGQTKTVCYNLGVLVNAKVFCKTNTKNLVYYLRDVPSEKRTLMWSLYIDWYTNVVFKDRTIVLQFPHTDPINSIQCIDYIDDWKSGLEYAQWYQSRRCDNWSKRIVFADRSVILPPFPKQREPKKVKLQKLYSGVPENEWTI